MTKESLNLFAAKLFNLLISALFFFSEPNTQMQFLIRNTRRQQ